MRDLFALVDAARAAGPQYMSLADNMRPALRAMVLDALAQAAPEPAPAEQWIDCWPVDRSGEPVDVFGSGGINSLGESGLQIKKRSAVTVECPGFAV